MLRSVAKQHFKSMSAKKICRLKNVYPHRFAYIFIEDDVITNELCDGSNQECNAYIYTINLNYSYHFWSSNNKKKLN